MLRYRKKVYNSHQYRLNGFTMVEIIVALAILSTSVLAVFGVLRMCASANNASQRLTESVFLAEKLLAETMLKDNIGFQTTEGNQGQFSWQIQTCPTGMDNLAAISVTVQWLDQQKPQQYQLYLLKHIPSLVEGR